MAGKIKNKRLFLALLLPEEALSFLSSLFQKLPGRPQAKENLHLTLFFFGQASSQEEGKIKEAFSKVALEEKPFTFSFADLSFFPSCSRPRGIWVKVGGRDEEDKKPPRPASGGWQKENRERYRKKDSSGEDYALLKLSLLTLSGGLNPDSTPASWCEKKEQKPKLSLKIAKRFFSCSLFGRPKYPQGDSFAGGC
jgi:hypothetical protein